MYIFLLLMICTNWFPVDVERDDSTPHVCMYANYAALSELSAS